ncbi:NAD-dependent deacetylase SRT1 [Micractinium conductrix]|uniref:protein acetyllysine N-acetyltransferase n=1 Tax=Micractinium conductrix TaxID=554055 RepID=A0A2P6V6N1_9CHLO|nr:NAD-dependent deacetylase SRT1 [Micractinium conductrix]|eukprot:PSC69749.1 NAD-dependent deacetylase SRT1 [Micractinium conductrix]
MSLGYAEKLSYRDDLGGQLGAPELSDSKADVVEKVERLAEMIQQARRVIAFTGAGISTACGIPDFRGPSGIWTLQRAGQSLPRPKVSFTHARPSLTHMVLVALMQAGKLDYLCSQNVDGLHLRSGIPRGRLAELHGNCFAERCHACGTEYIRDFEIETVGFKRTGRKCSQPGCGGVLKDHILDWEDALPEDELAETEAHAKEADLALCLGTSLQITPACNLPLKATRTYKGGTKQDPGRLAIVNLQRTQHDGKAERSGGLVLHARCDEVMRALAARLRLQVPAFVRRDAVVVGHQQHAPSRSTSGGGSSAAKGGKSASVGSGLAALELAGGSSSVKGSSEAAAADEADGDSGNSGPIHFSAFVQSSHGPKCRLPMVVRVDFAFEDATVKPASLTAPPFSIRRTARRAGPLRVRITLHLHEAADEDRCTVQLSYTADLQVGLPARASLCTERHEFVTQRVEYGAFDASAQDGSAAAAPAAEQAATEAAAAVTASVQPDVVLATVDLAEVDVMLVTHFHLDHCAAVPYVTGHTPFRGRVLMTHATKAIVHTLLKDFVKVSRGGSGEGLYTEKDLDAAMEKTEVVDFHQTVDVGGVRVTAYRACHVLGAAMFQVEIGGMRLLYTGDYSRIPDRHMPPADLPDQRPHIVVVESTYGVSRHLPREEREQRFVVTQPVLIEHRAERAAKVVGRLGEKAPSQGGAVRGLLVQGRGGERSLLHADDLPRFTKLHPGRVVQRQALALHRPFSEVRLALEMMFEGTQGAGDLGRVDAAGSSSGGGSGGVVLRIGGTVTLAYQPSSGGGAANSHGSAVLEWVSGSDADMVADAVVAVVLQAAGAPPGMEGAEAARRKALAAGDTGGVEAAELSILTALLGAQFGPARVDEDQGLIFVEVDGQHVVIANKGGAFKVECSDAALRGRVERALGRMRAALSPLDLGDLD